ncbi:MAG TPA: ATP-binding protein [Syntrophomonadaceae bacterium]|nr:ATP-binding protein [Syntrophomonadaceae bacterium]
MKELLILSGKGGTGKTTIASAFIKLANNKAYADVDVDAPNLHLVMNQVLEPKRSDYYGLDKAEIDLSLCTECDLCREHCRFDAISYNDVYEIDYFACEGCGVCEAICPVDAIALKPAIAGELMLYEEDEAVFSTAQLRMGSGNSGLLVTDVKKQLKSGVDKLNVAVEYAIIDGSPGIGCPVIASLNGVAMVLIVAEPSISGISDMERIIRTAEGFQSKIAVCINKYDTNIKNTEKIKSYCKSNNLPFVGEIPFDKDAVRAINNGQTIVDIECSSGEAVKGVFAETIKMLLN